GGTAAVAPIFSGLVALGAFASLGLPGLSGFIAEFQIFTGVIGSGGSAIVVVGALAILGILITAALFLRLLHRTVLGGPGELTAQVVDARRSEIAAIAPLLALSVLIGVAPRFLLDVIEPFSAVVVSLVAR
ncbi:NADH-quinone oxidoreductase subunit M, partial [Actinomadura sediminis]